MSDTITLDEFKRLHNCGWSSRRLAEHFHVTTRTISRWRSILGIQQPQITPRPAHDRERARELLDDGASYAEVADTLGVHAVTVARWYPGRGWTKTQVGEYAALLQRLAV